MKHQNCCEIEGIDDCQQGRSCPYSPAHHDQVDAKLSRFMTKLFAGLFLMALLLSTLAGCNQEEWGIDQCKRQVLFKECMAALPAGPKTTMYNDWDEVVDSCANAARNHAVLQDRRLIKPECRQ